MNFLTPSELRHTLKISRSTEHRLLKQGMPSLGAGNLRRYDEMAAVEWFRTYLQNADGAPAILEPGTYLCGDCRFEGTLQNAIARTQVGPCPNCSSREITKK